MLEGHAPIRILLVEDNPYDVKIVTELLRDIKNGGFSLTVAETMGKAEEARAQATSDVILLDLNLPDSFGPATLTRAAALFTDQPIIVMTGFTEEHLGIELIKKGAQDYLVKGKITGDWLAYSIKYSIERAKIERKLKARESRLRDILGKSPDGYAVVGRDGRVLFVNPGAERIFGRDRETLLKQPFPLDADTEKVLEAEVQRSDGRKLPVEIRAVEIHWDAEICRLVILQDLNPTRALERSRDEFISMISHELRSPLTVVKESMQLFYDGVLGPPTDKQKEIIKIGLDNAARLNRLIDALLDITKIEAGVMPMYISRADLSGLLAETAGDYAGLAGKKKISLTRNLPAAPVLTYCDIDKVREVLVNLVSNALKFTPEGGQITLSLNALEGDAILCVEDSGPGLDAEDIPKLFNKFAQLGHRQASTAKGTGLGLAISKGIVEMHRGRIWAETAPGKGCRFYVRLPLMDFEAAARETVRREIEFSGTLKHNFSVVTLSVPGKMLKDNPALAAKTEAFIREHLRSARFVLKRAEGNFVLLLSDSDAKNGCKAGAYIERNIAELAGPGADVKGEMTFLLSYPEDFNSEDFFCRKMAAARERINA